MTIKAISNHGNPFRAGFDKEVCIKDSYENALMQVGPITRSFLDHLFSLKVVSTAHQRFGTAEVYVWVGEVQEGKYPADLTDEWSSQPFDSGAVVWITASAKPTGLCHLELQQCFPELEQSDIFESPPPIIVLDGRGYMISADVPIRAEPATATGWKIIIAVNIPTT